jgi:hypothetical protein
MGPCDAAATVSVSTWKELTGGRRPGCSWFPELNWEEENVQGVEWWLENGGGVMAAKWRQGCL